MHTNSYCFGMGTAVEDGYSSCDCSRGFGMHQPVFTFRVCTQIRTALGHRLYCFTSIYWRSINWYSPSALHTDHNINTNRNRCARKYFDRLGKGKVCTHSCTEEVPDPTLNWERHNIIYSFEDGGQEMKHNKCIIFLSNIITKSRNNNIVNNKACFILSHIVLQSPW
jgi:hypothetical protein